MHHVSLRVSLRSSYLAQLGVTHHRPLPRSLSTKARIRAQIKRMEASERYGDWSREQLIARIAALENSLPGSPASAAQSGEASTSSSTATPSAATSALRKTVSTAPNANGSKRALKKPVRPFNFSAHTTRKIALRFCYDGAGYGGLAAQASGTPLPTVEGVLWEALCAARLVDPEKGMEDAGFSRCGRTDRGVSGAGQVVSLWVRSSKRAAQPRGHEQAAESSSEDQTSPAPAAGPSAEPEELPYVSTLNRLLPTSIRILAWSPVQDDFSARFNCRYRHYKYFFPIGAPPSLFPGPSSSASPPRLDIEAMRDAASRLKGEHDFRNLCKLDASKQIENFRRRIDAVSIDRVEDGWPTRGDGSASTQDLPDVVPTSGAEPMYVLNLRGSAFLWHQVRHIMAVLFLVGARLESPQLVDELLNVQEGALAADKARAGEQGQGTKWWHATSAEELEGAEASVEPSSSTASGVREDGLESTLERLRVYDTKPVYEMAHDRPLVLWDCGFDDIDVQWRAGTYDGPLPSSSTVAPIPAEARVGAARTTADLHTAWTAAAIRAELLRHFVLAGPDPSTGLLSARTDFDSAAFPTLPAPPSSLDGADGADTKVSRATLAPLGAGTTRAFTAYLPLSVRARQESVEIQNERWRVGAGLRRASKRGITPLELAKGRKPASAEASASTSANERKEKEAEAEAKTE